MPPGVVNLSTTRPKLELNMKNLKRQGMMICTGFGDSTKPDGLLVLLDNQWSKWHF